MPPPPLRTGLTEAQYRLHFETTYCRGPISTHDGVAVRFRKEHFDHCMYESDRITRVKLPTISIDRAQRIDWIGATLTNPAADLYQGWDSRNKCICQDRRVAVVYEEFVVVIWVKNMGAPSLRADFVTAFLADNSIGKIRAQPKWAR